MVAAPSLPRHTGSSDLHTPPPGKRWQACADQNLRAVLDERAHGRNQRSTLTAITTKPSRPRSPCRRFIQGNDSRQGTPGGPEIEIHHRPLNCALCEVEQVVRWP